jgi:RimJ/RimL family protein N-acetyltransferase
LIITGYDKEVAAWVASKIPFASNLHEKPCTAIGIAQDNDLVGGVVFNNFIHYDDKTSNIEMHVAGVGNWLSRGALYAFFSYPFNQLGCNLVIGAVPKKAKHTRKFDEKIGFKLRGVLPGFFPGDDACMYTMNRNECRWI